MRLENKVAIITGSSRGIGLSVAKSFVREGAKVAICDLSLENCKKAVSEIERLYPDACLLPIEVDVTDSDKVRKMVDKVVDTWSTIDILVNNAGITQTKGIMDLTDDEFFSVININTGGVFRCTREVAKIMAKKGSGSIINTSSMVGIYGSPMQASYSASKFAINGLTKNGAKELGRYGIRVNAVAPGVVETDMVRESVSTEMKNQLQRMIPLGKTAGPEDLAETYVYLASDDSKYTNGTIISVDGGLVM